MRRHDLTAPEFVFAALRNVMFERSRIDDMDDVVLASELLVEAVIEHGDLSGWNQSADPLSMAILSLYYSASFLVDAIELLVHLPREVAGDQNPLEHFPTGSMRAIGSLDESEDSKVVVRS